VLYDLVAVQVAETVAGQLTLVKTIVPEAVVADSKRPSNCRESMSLESSIWKPAPLIGALAPPLRPTGQPDAGAARVSEYQIRTLLPTLKLIAPPGEILPTQVPS
jgi:hypothetical protein